MVNVFIMGKKYSVPSELTIMDAMEYAGYQLVRGCGCRNGFCGFPRLRQNSGDAFQELITDTCILFILPHCDTSTAKKQMPVHRNLCKKCTSCKRFLTVYPK